MIARHDFSTIDREHVNAWKWSLGALRRRFLKASNQADMEDFSQMAWVAVLKVRKRGFSGESLRRIAARQAVAEWIFTYGKRSKWVGGTVGYDLDQLADRPGQVRGVIDDKWWQDLTSAGKDLTSTMRAVLEAVIVDEVSQAEVADRLGLKESTVRTLVCRAKQRIRKAAEAMNSKPNDLAKAQQAADNARVADALDKIGDSLADMTKILEQIRNEIRTKFNTKEIPHEK
jgi:RNA polymerase sigma factor (sigma-70 family)